MYTNLFSSIKINNKLKIKNRIAYPSLGLLYSYDSKLNSKYYNFYNEIAKGGAGIVTIGPVGIDYIGSGFFPLSLAKDDVVNSFIKATNMIKTHKASPWVQLFHAGAYTAPFLINNKTPIAPSAIFSKYSKTTPLEMTIKDIQTVQKAFVNAAKRAKKAGFEGIEIIGSAGYLISQFLSPLTNTRKDEYGGSLENLVRFPRQIIEMVREAIGSDLAIGIRMAGNDFVTGSIKDTETPKIARIYEKAGVDIINVTGGWHESKVPQLPMELPRSGFSCLAMNIKQAVSIPVMASNRITTPDHAEQILKDGQADMINLGRVLIADPFWPEKAKRGKPEEIRPCVACSQGCTDELFSGLPVFCIGNVRAGFEGERDIVKSTKPKNVMVVGAGVAGLEAALTAKKAGFCVEIYEKEKDIGGQIWIAAAPPHKKELLEYIRYYRAMLKKYGISVHLNTLVGINLIKKVNPDHLIVAQGAKPFVPPIEGANDTSVLSSWDVLKNNPRLGKNVAVIGGGAVGLETAFYVAQKGTITPEMLHFFITYEAMELERIKHYMFNGSSKVTVFEMMSKVGKDVGKSTKWILMSNLKRYGVKIKTNAKVISVKNGNVEFEENDKKTHEQFDNVILALGSIPVQDIEKQLKNHTINFSTIGDCVIPGKINNAIHGGFLAATKI